MTKHARMAIQDKIGEILEGLGEMEGALIPLLQGVQRDQGYISEEAVEAISDALDISPGEVYGVATFYSEFRLNRPGEHQIKVCMGTSCYLKGGGMLLERIIRRLGITPGGTTPDGRFSLETVACLGCCSRSPVLSLDGVIYGNVSPSTLDSILSGADARSPGIEGCHETSTHC